MGATHALSRPTRRNFSAPAFPRQLDHRRPTADANQQWPPNFDPNATGFSKDLAAVPTRCHVAFRSNQPRMLIETRGTYNGSDPRALQADGRYSGFHLDKQYEGEALVTAYRESGLVASNGPRIQDRQGPAYGAPPLSVTPKGTLAYTTFLGGAHAAKRSPFFATRQTRFTPSRTYVGSDPRAIQADDPFDGRHDHIYQPQSGYYAPYDPSELSKEERKRIAQATAAAKQDGGAKGASSPPSKEGGASKQQSSQPLLNAAAKAGLADPRVVGKYDEPLQWAEPAPASFHDTNDQFRYGVLTKQPSRPHSTFISSLPRLPGRPKPLEPYHRERYGSEMSVREYSGFINRPLAGVGLRNN